MAAQQTEIRGVFSKEFWRSDNGSGDFAVGSLADGTKIKGNWTRGELLPGSSYRFTGRAEQHPRYGESFAVSAWSIDAPATAAGLCAYLRKFAPNFGEVRARKLHGLYGAKAIDVLKADPPAVAKAINGLSVEQATEAAYALRAVEQFEAVRVDLVGLLDGQGFRRDTAERLIRLYGSAAAEIIRRDPFRMMVVGIPGAGFARVDGLYRRLWLPPDRLKRQVYAALDVIRSDFDGHVWFSERQLVEGIAERVSSPNADRAFTLATRAGLLAERRDSGGRWFALADQAECEAYTAGRLAELVGLANVADRADRPAECDGGDAFGDSADVDAAGELVDLEAI